MNYREYRINMMGLLVLLEGLRAGTVSFKQDIKYDYHRSGFTEEEYTSRMWNLMYLYVSKADRGYLNAVDWVIFELIISELILNQNLRNLPPVEMDIETRKHYMTAKCIVLTTHSFFDPSLL